MKSLKYISIIILLLSSLGARTQSLTPPWHVVATGSNHTIFIKATVNPSLDGTSLENGDAIGVFYDSANTLACAGYITWNSTNSFITAYGADGINDGLKSNELFKFKIWKQQTNCVVDSVTTAYTSGGAVTNTNRYADNGISELSMLAGINKLKAEYFRIQVTQSTCIAGGKILIESASTMSVADLHFAAYDVLTGQEFTSPANELVELPEAEYRLMISTDGCSLEWPETLTVTKDHNCNFPVISPNKDGVAEDYYIPYQGTAKIYDRYGVLKAELSTPSAWNATDNAGRLLPMGTYVIICDGQKEIMITVVR